jgi:hypothetical protein
MQKHRPFPKITKAKKSRECSLSGRACLRKAKKNFFSVKLQYLQRLKYEFKAILFYQAFGAI